MLRADGRVCEEEIIKGKRWINVFAPRFTALYCQRVCVCELKGGKKDQEKKNKRVNCALSCNP